MRRICIYNSAKELHPLTHGDAVVVRGRARLRTLVIGAVTVFLRCLSPAQTQCSAEAKVLISTEQTKAAVASLNAAAMETAGHVYLFDTAALDLLSQGVIVRLRQGSSADLTVKVRSRVSNELSGTSSGREKFKCEVDIVGSEEQRSYSIQRKLAGRQIAVPSTGSEIFRMLSASQKDLLRQAHISTDWKLVKRIVGIEARSWRIKPQPTLNSVALELWQWSTGQVLELSARADTATGRSVYSQLQQLATSKGLSLVRQQQFKTTLVLQEVAGAGAR